MPKDAKPAKSAEVMVVNNQSHLVFFGGRKLRPGVNKVPREMAEAMKKNPHISKVSGIVISDDAPATKGLDIPAAKELVEKTHDDSLLHEYQAEDGRPAVAKAIADKRETLKPSEKKDS